VQTCSDRFAAAISPRRLPAGRLSAIRHRIPTERDERAARQSIEVRWLFLTGQLSKLTLAIRLGAETGMLPVNMRPDHEAIFTQRMLSSGQHPTCA
jgi:hypothetical protein